MLKKLLAASICLLLLLGLSGCSGAESVGSWLDKITAGASDIIPNDVELILGQLAGKEEPAGEHEVLFSQGYVNMLKSGNYYIVYHLADGTEVQFGYNGVRSGSSYPEPAETENTEPQYDEEGNEIEQAVPREHIVLSDGIYYYVDDAQKKLFTVNPDNYKAVPFDISTEGMAFSGAGEETVDGKTCRFERYSTDSGSVTFYFYNAELYALTVEQGSVHTLLNITAFNKYLDSTLVTLPSSYNVVQYWPGE